MRGVKPQTKLVIAARREKVAQALLAGLTYREIAKELKAGLATIAADVKAILAALETETLQDAGEYRKLELRRLDMMHNTMWGPAMRGSMGAVDRLISIQNQRAKYMTGLQDSSKHELEFSPAGYLDMLRQADKDLEEQNKPV